MISIIEIERYRWYIVRVAPNTEGKAQKRLSTHGICSFLPIEKARVRRTVNRGKIMRIRTRPMLQGYIFVGVSDMAAAFRAMFACGLVRGVICDASSGRPYELAPKEIAKLNRTAFERAGDRTPSTDPIRVRVGETVRIRDGAATGSPASIIAIDSYLRRAKIEMPIFGRLTVTDISVDALAGSL